MSQISRFNPSKLALPENGTYIGIVKGQTTGPADHGPQSMMSYRVFINFPDSPQEVDGVFLVSDQFQDDESDVRPLKVGTVVLIAHIAGQLQATGIQIPHLVPCNQSRASIEQNAIANLIGTIKTMTAQQKQIVAKELGL